MAKFTATKLFEYAKVAGTPAGKELEEFITFVNQNFEQIIRGISGNLTLEDNIKGQKLTLSLIHNREVTTTVNGGDVVGILPLRVLTDSNVKEAFENLSWWVNSSGKLVLYPQFKNASATESLECTIYILKQ